MSTPEPPILINEHGDVMIFATVQSAEQYLEPIDVENKEYVGYDALGRKLAFSTTRQQITIGLADELALYQAELEGLVRAFLGAVRHPAATNPALTRAELIEQCASYAQK
jgi:hypothetical protein